MKLYIAEKPSLARAIVAALPKPHKKLDGYYQVGNGDLVSWCIGHILEQAQPEKYDPAFKKWQFEHLPIVPEQWQLTPKYKTRSQLAVLRKLVKQCPQIIHAGDPDREGQLLVDEVLDYLNIGERKKSDCQRLLISDLNLSAVKRALSQLKRNTEFMPLSISALARSRADWLYGINLTRAYTLAGQKSGYNSVLSVGRVQTPVLGLVVMRDQAIDEFVSKPYFQVDAIVADDQGTTFKARWQPSEACQPYMDEQGHVLVRKLAENVVQRIANQPAQITDISDKQHKQAAPLLYNLSSLQIDAAKIFSLKAQTVLDTCQSLYERHKLITYPRSDCRYLPKEHHADAAKILANLASDNGRYKSFAEQADSKQKSRAFNDSKVSAHHAIVPTLKSAKNITLSDVEEKVYSLICRQYIAQFLANYVFNKSQLTLDIAGGRFVAKAKHEQQLGWKQMYQSKRTTSADDSEPLQNVDFNQYQKGQRLHCKNGDLLEKHTQPPSSFTDATLLEAMTNIARFVADKDIKQILKENDGLGTEATRAGIIELLFKRGYLERNGKQIKATLVGKALINALPEPATKPDLTAKWESSLNAICEKQMGYQQFMQPLLLTINDFIQAGQKQDFSGLPKKAFKPKRRFRKKSGSGQKKSA
ncbi:DNA topoisomerase III [Thalassotalea sp. HSM 43]|uniref:DNA topoisomerase III n=1 Tax=Thalassotalea sp. HSM 43 TaxID=2552945 RepID=UPI00108210FC|nr:DNA topoisomerase III [Thalassotalea sp. HSM 43]QBY03745.1 DNA topoisomerase III [Thalassotalea sp. HSM 43]